MQVTGVDIPGRAAAGHPGRDVPPAVRPRALAHGERPCRSPTTRHRQLRQPADRAAGPVHRLLPGARSRPAPTGWSSRPRDVFSIQDAVVQGTGTAASPAPARPRPRRVVVRGRRPRGRCGSARAARSYLVVDENFNPGWQAVIGGRTLAPVRLDGWKQAWVLPAGTSGLVRLTFGPERLFRVTVFGGLAVLALVRAGRCVAGRARGRRGPPPAQFRGMTVTALDVPAPRAGRGWRASCCSPRSWSWPRWPPPACGWAATRVPSSCR